MIDKTINDDKTIAGSGKDMISRWSLLHPSPIGVVWVQYMQIVQCHDIL